MTGGAERFELDPAVRRRDRGRLLVGGVPPRLIRLSEAGAAALDAILAGDADERAAPLAARLERHGFLHPLPASPRPRPRVTTVIPVLDGGEVLLRLVRALLDDGPVIVVDDGSTDGSPERAAAAGAAVIANAGRPGPAGARNTGLRAAASELVAFLDADCLVRPGWHSGLAAFLARDQGLALVAPRVRSAPGDSLLARYEEAASPLDLGPAPSLVGADRRIAYVPSAALLGRRADLLAVGGFDEAMRFGEDVDLVWRLLAAGRRIRYVPSIEVRHEPRADARSLARQRAGYGAAAPDLARRHPHLASPLTMGPAPALAWATLPLLGPRAFALSLAASVALVARRGEDGAARQGLVEVAARGHLTAARQLSQVLLREWLPLSLCLATRHRRARRLLLAAALIDTVPAWRGVRRPQDAPAVAALRALDRGAYAAGLWREMARRGDPRAVMPSLRRR
ncbi:MAG: mycofactocin biosynthesis glycosyltransferase MftF [Actinobacteria bacterium]|nr:mycofactocin biosynthesis glycosyltransferase MftF [Actinomycetota bacterium]